jgi:hypothetical protein
MDDNEVIRIAVRASLACVGTVLACLLALFVLVAAVSPSVNIPGIHLSHHSVVRPPAGD